MSDYAWNEYDPCRSPREPRATMQVHIKVYAIDRIYELYLSKDEAKKLLSDLTDILGGEA